MQIWHFNFLLLQIPCPAVHDQSLPPSVRANTEVPAPHLLSCRKSACIWQPKSCPCGTGRKKRSRRRDCRRPIGPSPGRAARCAGRRYVIDHPERVAGRSVLDFGSGSGLVAIAAAKAARAQFSPLISTRLPPPPLRSMRQRMAQPSMFARTTCWKPTASGRRCSWATCVMSARLPIACLPG